MYGVFKKFATDNNHDLMAKQVNSAYASTETRKTLKAIHDYVGYYSQLVIHNDKCYVTFINNIGGTTDAEYQTTITLTLAIFNLQRVLSDDFDYKKDVKLHRFGGVGTKIAGHTASSGLQAPSMLIIGDKLYISMSFDSTEEKRWASYAYEYDLVNEKFTDEFEMMLNYKGKISTFNIDAVNHIYSQEGYKTTSPSLISFSNRWSEYKGEYYITVSVGSVDCHNGIVIKTKDFKTVEFVSVVKGNDNGQCEVVSCILKDKLYVACRQPWTTPYLVFMRYDLETDEWTKPYKIEDGNARPCIFAYRDELYLFNTIEEVGSGRRFANISKIRTETAAHNGRNAPINRIATLFQCGDHPCYFIYKDKIYFSMQQHGKVHFGELKLKEFSPTKVNQKLIELFGDVE